MYIRTILAVWAVFIFGSISETNAAKISLVIDEKLLIMTAPDKINGAKFSFKRNEEKYLLKVSRTTKPQKEVSLYLVIPNPDYGNKNKKWKFVSPDKNKKKFVSSGRLSPCPRRENHYYIRWRDVTGKKNLGKMNTGIFRICTKTK